MMDDTTRHIAEDMARKFLSKAGRDMEQDYRLFVQVTGHNPGLLAIEHLSVLVSLIAGTVMLMLGTKTEGCTTEEILENIRTVIDGKLNIAISEAVKSAEASNARRQHS